MNQAALDLGTVAIAEQYLLSRLEKHRIFVYPPSEQFPAKERIRRAIIDNKCEYTIVGRNSANRKPETYMACFERAYGEPLEPKSKRTGKC